MTFNSTILLNSFRMYTTISVLFATSAIQLICSKSTTDKLSSWGVTEFCFSCVCFEVWNVLIHHAQRVNCKSHSNVILFQIFRVIFNINDALTPPVLPCIHTTIIDYALPLTWLHCCNSVNLCSSTASYRLHSLAKNGLVNRKDAIVWPWDV